MELTTREGEAISHLLTDYAGAFIREKEAVEIRSRAETSPIAAPSVLPPPPTQDVTAAPNTIEEPPVKPPPPPGRPKSAVIPPATVTHTATLAQQHHAAIAIQALYRGFALRVAWLREECAILIQAAYRGYRARSIVSAMIEQLFLSGELRFDSDEEED